MCTQRCLLIMLPATLIVLGGCQPQVERLNIGTAGGSLVLGGASLDVPSGALGLDVLVTLEQNAPGQTVELVENESAISDVFTLSHGQQALLDTAGEPFRLKLPFDTTALGKATPNEAEVFVKAATEDGEFSLLGTIAEGEIEILLYGLPEKASFQVVYNPNCIIQADTEDTGKALPSPTPWETTEWCIHYDITATQLRTVLGTILNKEPSAVTRDEAIQIINSHVRVPAHELAVTYQDMGFRQPHLEARAMGDGTKKLVLNIVSDKSYFDPTNENGFGQLNIAYPTIAWDTAHRLGSCKGVIAHETFHAIVSAYKFNMGPAANHRRAYAGFNEGMSTVMGHTVEHDGVIHVRDNTAERSYTLMLNQPLGVFEPRITQYTNDDFFAYVGKRFGPGGMSYLVGSDMDGDVRNGVLEETLKYMAAHPELVPGTSSADAYLTAYRTSLHNSFSLQFASSLAYVYWDFAKNRAYENNAESRLRSADSTVPCELRTERFEPAGMYEHAFGSDSENVELSYETLGVLNSIPPFSTRALLFTASGFNAKLTITFETSNWLGDSLGNSMKVKVYKTGQDGTEITRDNNAATVDRFGTDVRTVLVLLSNVDVEGPYSLLMSAKTEPSDTHVGPCAPNGTTEEPWDRWLIEYDYNCDGTIDADNLWHFLDDGTISEHWTGVIDGYSWRVEGNKMIISWGNGGGLEGTFSEDCQRIENGTYFGDFVTTDCWKAEMW